MKHTVAALEDLEPGTARRFTLGGADVAIVRIDDDVYAIADTCSHAQVSLSEGEVWCEEREIECPQHGSTFDLASGEPLTLPATQPVAVYGVDVVDGQVVVTIGDDGDDGDDGDEKGGEPR